MFIYTSFYASSKSYIILMNKTVHRIYVYTLSSIVVIVFLYLAIKGYSYYSTPLEERFYHPDHEDFKPSGFFGHGLGIIGTLLIFIGVVMYIARKRYLFLGRFGRLKYWLEFHIFLCSVGPVMVLFHTAFKFGGIVSIAFWSMVAVVASGVIGRFIYIQIPRSIEGEELSLGEIKELKINIENILKNNYSLDEKSYYTVLQAINSTNHQPEGGFFSSMVNKFFEDRKAVRKIKKLLKQNGLKRRDKRHVLRLVKNEIQLNNRIQRLQTMQQLFKYWHVAHLPFALIMLIIVLLHIGVTIAFGATWIF